MLFHSTIKSYSFTVGLKTLKKKVQENIDKIYFLIRKMKEEGFLVISFTVFLRISHFHYFRSP